MENQYFRLCISDKLRHPLEVLGLSSQYRNSIKKEDFDALDGAVVAYFSSESHPEISDVMEAPAFLLSDQLKHIFGLYDPQFQGKIIQLFAGEPECKDNYLYWFPYLPAISCLHPAAEKYPNGMLKKLVLDKTEIPLQSHYFKVAGILEHRVIVSLPLAESILRRCPYGIDLQPVEVR